MRPAPRSSRGTARVLPTPTPKRLTGIDVARGLAVVLMVLAHTSPSAIDLPAEYLTAPLFGLLIGVSLQLAWAKAAASGHLAVRAFIVLALLRGAILLGLGIALSRVYLAIDIVLQVLGLLMIALAPLVAALRGRWPWALGAAAALWAISPVVMTAAREAQGGWAAPPPGWLATLWGWTLSGPHYRLVSHLVFGLVGVALAAWLPRRTHPGRLVGALAGVTVTAYGLGHVLVRSGPYTGDHFELVGSAAFATGATMACVWLTDRLGDRSRLLVPLATVGRLALTAYTLQILLLAGLARRAGPMWQDDQWWVLATTLAAAVGFCLVWDRLIRRPGPLEWLIRLPRYAVRGR